MTETPAEKRAGLARLRDPFPPEQINKLPKPTISNDEWKKLPKATCKECGGYHATSKTVHLDFVGHAALTARLLEADEAWTWDFLSLGTDGYPVIDKDGGMWIKLTVCGVTRLGYGDAQGKTGGNAMKERIGDALRNAAMRFGAALDLWHKGEAPLFSDGESVDSPLIPNTKNADPTKDALRDQSANESLTRIQSKLDTLTTLSAIDEWEKIARPTIDTLPPAIQAKANILIKSYKDMATEVADRTITQV